MDRERELFNRLNDENMISGEEYVLDSYFSFRKQFDTDIKYSDLDQKKYNKKELSEYISEISKRVDLIKKNYFPEENYKIIPWIRNYCKAKDYYEQNGHLVPEVEEVWEFHGDLFKIYNWVKSQRTLYNSGNYSDVKVKLLDEIGMVWELDKNNDYK